MSLLDKVIGAVTPPESAQARQRAREDARALATPGSWFAMVLDHHVAIESCIAEIRGAPDASSRRLAQKQLAIVLTGHSVAEENVLYPALSEAGEKAHMTAGYTEQSAVKVQMAMLEELEPGSQDYLDKLEHIDGALRHHMYEEEGTWFPAVWNQASDSQRSRLDVRFREEYDRYVGRDVGPIGVHQQAPSLATL